MDDDDDKRELIDCLKSGKLTEAAKTILEGLRAREAKVLRERFEIGLGDDASLQDVGK